MPAQYLDEFIRELRRDGEQTFRGNHDAPVLIVTKAAGEMASEDKFDGETTVMADTTGWRIQQVSLINRVFKISLGAFATARPIVLGRSDKADIVIPDDSVSKRHCAFEIKSGGMAVMDAGSTNGTSVNDVALEPNKPAALEGGDSITTGHFSFTYYTPDGFIAYLKQVVKI
jgi:hypothetical protein